MSGYADDPTICEGVNHLGALFIAKPFAPDCLAKQVREILNGNLPSSQQDPAHRLQRKVG